MKDKVNLKYGVITWEQYDICFLIPPSFKIEKQVDGFKYQGGKNSGYLQMTQGALSLDYKPSQFAEFPGAYKKTRDLRLFEYQIQGGVVLKDAFDFVKKQPANIIPVRKNCKIYLKRYSKLFNI